MALVRCKECGKEISDKAEKCPNCGNKIRKENKNNVNEKSQIRTGSIVSLIANILIIMLIGWLLISPNLPQNPETSSTGGVHVTISGGPEVVDFIYGIFILVSIILSIFCTIWIILFLCNKIKNVKIYKIVFLIASIIECITGMLSVNGLLCCGMCYSVFPVISLIGAIIAVTGKE